MSSCTYVYVAALAAAVLCAGAFAQSGESQPADAAAAIRLEGAALVAAIHARVEELLPTSPHPLFTRHLQSVDALVQADWARAALLAGRDEKGEKYAHRTLEFCRRTLDGLQGDAGEWDSYAAGNRSLVMAFVSGYDATLQPYHLRLPRDFDPEKAYPVLIYLHGHVPNPHMLWYASLPMTSEKAQPSEEHMLLKPHFELSPWGRGNTGYRTAGETDVWEALADADAMFNFDPDAMILTGHSMGAFGTWSLAVRTPDRWAAIAMYAGGARGTEGMVANLAHVPVLLWHGEKDRTVPASNSKTLCERLAAVGNEAVLKLNPEAGHMVPRGEKTPHKLWLLEHRRQRPDRFSFMADQPEHTECWGIRLPRIVAGGAIPQFECRIEGQTVSIYSLNAAGLDVNLGEGGLGLDGEVIKVVWNGDQAYEGPAQAITLGEGAGRPRWRR